MNAVRSAHSLPPPPKRMEVLVSFHFREDE
ncbi:MAG: hypothetical protein LBE85_02605 [Candidatus Accumulibacter sp.]|nr:hypothetical protein [Accumulibacter sp.]MDR2450664.1 hypothetical protein [Accumulibacter sp.]